ncbi:MAG TPA: hypothetical protein DCP91_12140 [Eggerthellaceae bacterium]|nr:hypothetical protein [Eggerthellaceae bacterium]
MKKNFGYIAGTAALDLSYLAMRDQRPHIIAFPDSCLSENQGKSLHDCEAGARRGLAARFRDVLDSSEMYCSLKTEDFRGCAYQAFTSRGIAALASAISVVAALSIALQ